MAATTVRFSDDGEDLVITFKLSKKDRKSLNSLLPDYPKEYSRALAELIEEAIRTKMGAKIWQKMQPRS